MFYIAFMPETRHSSLIPTANLRLNGWDLRREVERLASGLSCKDSRLVDDCIRLSVRANPLFFATKSHLTYCLIGSWIKNLSGWARSVVSPDLVSKESGGSPGGPPEA